MSLLLLGSIALATPFDDARQAVEAAAAAFPPGGGATEVRRVADDALALAAQTGPSQRERTAEVVVDAWVHVAHLAARGDAVEAPALAFADALPSAAGPVRSALTAASFAELDVLADPPPLDSLVATLASAGVRVNSRLDALDALPAALAAALRPVQPAIVRIRGNGAATGVNLAPRGLVLTNAHLADHVGLPLQVQFPDGSLYAAICTAVDPHHDLALLTLVDAFALPVAHLAPHAPPSRSSFVLIGNPGGPYGPPFTVVRGAFTGGGLPLRGEVAHDAPTDWGHSGSPLLDAEGRIVALHAAYDSDTHLRYAVGWAALRAFVPVLPD